MIGWAPIARIDSNELGPEQLALLKRRFPELLEEQQCEVSATDLDYFKFD